MKKIVPVLKIISLSLQKKTDWVAIVKKLCLETKNKYLETPCPDKDKAWACVSDNKKEIEDTWHYKTVSARDLKFRKIGCKSIKDFTVKE